MLYNLINKSFLGLALLVGSTESSYGNIPIEDRKPRIQYSYRHKHVYNLPLDIVIPTEIFQADLIELSKKIT